MATDTVTNTLGQSATLNDSLTVAGAAARVASASQTNQNTWTSSNANAAALGADTIYGPILITVATSATNTITLSNSSISTNNGTAIAVTAGRIKGLMIWLVGTGQKTQDQSAGNACSSIHVGGTALAGAARPIKTSDAAASLAISNGMSLTWMFDQGGTGFTVATGATDTITIKNDDGANIAQVVINLILGSN